MLQEIRHASKVGIERACALCSGRLTKKSCWLAGHTVERVAAARAIAFDVGPQSLALDRAPKGEATNPTATPISSLQVLQSAADIFKGPFSPDLAAKGGIDRAKDLVNAGVDSQWSVSPDGAASIGALERRAIQKARKTTKGSIPKQKLLNSELPSLHQQACDAYRIASRQFLQFFAIVLKLES